MIMRDATSCQELAATDYYGGISGPIRVYSVLLGSLHVPILEDPMHHKVWSICHILP